MVKQKRRINAREFIADIQAGLSDDALMEKYQLSESSLHHMFEKLLASGHVTQAQLDDRGKGLPEVPTELRTCPACGKRYAGVTDECPNCGVIASRFEARQRAQELAAAQKKQRRRRLKIVAALCLFGVLIIAAGVGYVYFAFFGDSGDSSTQTVAKQQGKAKKIDIDLIDAAKMGDLARVNALLKQGANVHAQTIGGFTALMHAAAGGHPEMVKVLLDRGADTEARGNYYKGETALMMAARRGHTEVVDLLIDNGAKVDTASKHSGSTPLMLAAYDGHLDTVKKLLDEDATVDARDKAGGTALMSAVSRGHWAVAKALLEGGADVNAEANEGTPLVFAGGGGRYDGGQLEVVELLLKNDANVNGSGKDGWTPLMRASRHNCPDVIAVLLKNGANIDAQNKKGETALILAASSGHAKVVDLLLKNGASPEVRDHKGWTALKHAESKKRTDVAEILRKSGG